MYPSEDLENLCEELVYEQIHKIIEAGEPEFPSTNVSIQDVAAIALNNMPPKYICNFLEKNYPSQTLLEEVSDLKKYARRQVLKAVKKVIENPHE